MSSLASYSDNESLLQKAKNGDEEAKTQIYEANVGLIYMVLERFKGTAYEYEDLFQVGSIGLIKAIDKFDFSFNVKFSTYAVPMIIGEIKKFLRDDGIVKVQRSYKEMFGKIRWAQDKLRGDLGREPNVGEIAACLDIEKEEVIMAIEACQSPAYIHDCLPGNENESISLLDRLTAEDHNVALLEHMALREALGKLNEREQKVIIRRFFKDETQTVIAQDLGVSQVQVSRIEKSALNKLKGILL